MKDDLNGCRGILNGLILGAIFWVIVLVLL